MTLLCALLAAIVSTILWYRDAPEGRWRFGTLCALYWGASLMWLVDAIFEFVELGAEYFLPAPGDMLNDLFLGLSVLALGLLIWLGRLLFSDPKGVLGAALRRRP